ncbi:hypothetical protein HanPI659440_Chr09g0325851 [Helianthus annuus]|nr:hypothetical protein HanPI659440_Chr09g0325851 [Helianthus annuus]
MLQVIMSSSESSGLSEEHDPMAIVSDDEIAPVPEIFTSDSKSDPEMMPDDEDLDEFQPFALPDFGDDDIPLEDDVLALPLPIHDQLIIAHPDGEHVVEPILIHAIPLCCHLAEDWPFIVDLDNDVEVLVFQVDLPLRILAMVRAAGLEAYPADDDDAMSAAPAKPTLVSTPTDTPPRSPTHVTSGGLSQPPTSVGRSSWIRHIHFASAFPHTPPTHEGEPSGHPHVSPPEMSPRFQPPRSFPPSPPHVMPSSDPYHPSHHSGYTRDALLLSLQLQVEIL